MNFCVVFVIVSRHYRDFGDGLTEGLQGLVEEECRICILLQVTYACACVCVCVCVHPYCIHVVATCQQYIICY